MQKYIREVLKDKWQSLPDMLWDIISISQTATTSTPLGDLVADHKTRLQAKKLLLELWGYYKTKSDVNVHFNLTKLLYSN